MKRLLTLIASVACGVMAHGAAPQELVKGVDLTGITSPSAAQLNQLVDRAYPASGRGFVYVASAAPDTTNYTRFTNYLWLDISTLPGSLKSYATGSWVSASIGVGAVSSANLAADAVISGKIAANAVWTTNINDNAITSAKILAGAITDSKYAAGSITTGAISNSTVNSDIIIDGTIVTADIAASQITGALIANGSVSNIHLATGFQLYNTNLAAGSVTSSNIVANAIQTTNIAGSAVTRTNLSFSLYTNNTPAAVAIPAAGATATIAHGLAATPQIVRTVLRNTSTDDEWDAGDEVEIWAFSDASAANVSAFAVYVDATNVNIVRSSDAGGVYFMTKDGGVAGTIDTSKWEIKAYCVNFP